ncbi:MAG: BrnA antitoxin family protein [Stellaceae bacterium]
MARLRRMTDAELEDSIRNDPDWNQVPREWYLKAKAAMPVRKRLVSVRLDADVLDWFKSRGVGYQTRINAVLRSFMDEEKRRGEG